MFKRVVVAVGIILLLIASIVAIRTFDVRRKNKEIVPVITTTPAKTTIQDKAMEATELAQTITPPSFDKTKRSTTDPTSPWVVVNKKYPLTPLQYAPVGPVWIGERHQMVAEAADALSALIATAKAEGLTVRVISGYRSYSTQATVYGNEVKNNGQEIADTQSAKPGYSEHQTGWAADVGGGGCDIDNCFADTAEGKWVASHAYEYGFIIRYPVGKQDITGYRAEPWHIRFVGTELSYEMRNQNITTLEEFFGL